MARFDSGDGSDARRFLFTAPGTPICPGDPTVTRSQALASTPGILLCVQYAPDIDVIGMLDVEHKVQVARQRPYAQTR